MNRSAYLLLNEILLLLFTPEDVGPVDSVNKQERNTIFNLEKRCKNFYIFFDQQEIFVSNELQISDLIGYQYELAIINQTRFFFEYSICSAQSRSLHFYFYKLA